MVLFGYIITGVKLYMIQELERYYNKCKNPALFPLAGLNLAQSMVFAGVYPLFTDDYEELRAFRKITIK